MLKADLSDRKERMALAARVKEALTSLPRGSKKKLADACDITPQALTGWVSTGRVNKTNLAKLSDASNFELTYLITGTGPKLKPDKTVMAQAANPKHGSDAIESLTSSYQLLSSETLPLLDAAQAMAWPASMADHKIRPNEGMINHTQIPVTANAFAFPVKGDSMAPDFNPGEDAIVEPGLDAKHEDFVLVEIAGDVVIRQLWREAGDWLLIPSNKDYTKKPLADNRIIGVVTWAVPRPVCKRK